MSKENIEISKQGIKFSYIRFLSDSAAGYILLLIFIIACYHDYPFLGHSIVNICNLNAISKDIQVLIAILLFLIATPLGLTMNALSFFCLAWLQNYLAAKLIDSNSIMMKNTRELAQLDEWRDFFGLNYKTWYKHSVIIENIVEVYYPDLLETVSYVQGLKTLHRNIALISLLILINWCINSLIIFKLDCISFDFIQFFVFFPLCVSLNAMLSFYKKLMLFNKAFILCIEKATSEEINLIKKNNESINEIRNLLVFRHNLN